MISVSIVALAVFGQTTQPMPGAASAPGIAATIEIDAKSGQRIYRAQTDSCEVRWTIQISRAEEGALRHHAKCTLPVEQQAPLYEAVIDRVLKDKLTLRTMAWGRIDPDGTSQDHTLARRLALAAKSSKEWNSKTGRGAKGNDNKAVKDILNGGQVFVEIERIFDERGYKIEFRSIEKVLVMPAKKLPFFAQLEPEGVTAADRLPFDAQVSFALKAKNQPEELR